MDNGAIHEQAQYFFHARTVWADQLGDSSCHGLLVLLHPSKDVRLHGGGFARTVQECAATVMRF